MDMIGPSAPTFGAGPSTISTPQLSQVRHDVLRRDGRREAQIHAAGHGTRRRRPFAARIRLANVDLLAAEAQRRALPRPELLALHAEHALIPGGGDLRVPACQDQVVQAINREAHYPSPS